MISKHIEELRFDHKIIGEMIDHGSHVLDMGCGEGDLLEYLVEKKDVKGTGVEINEEAIYSCVEKGLSVAQGDIDTGMSDYPDGLFDIVIFNQTMQQVHKPKDAILEALRIGKKVIIGFPNFCYYKALFQLTVLGHVPITPALPYSWYDTPNLHCLSIKDFNDFCKRQGIRIEKKVFLDKDRIIRFMPNLLALDAIFQISKP